MSPLNARKDTAIPLSVIAVYRFLRAAFGAQATETALRQVTAYRGIPERDIANVWATVLQDLKRR